MSPLQKELSPQRTNENAEFFEDFLCGLGAPGGKFFKNCVLEKAMLLTNSKVVIASPRPYAETLPDHGNVLPCASEAARFFHVVKSPIWTG